MTVPNGGSGREECQALIDLEDPVALTQALVRCPSVTPEDGGAQRLLASWLERLGFVVHRLRFGGDGTASVENLFARIGDGGPHLAFAGHTDVVPPGDPSSWHVDPFAATIEGDELIGRGAADMKSGIACFVAALARHRTRHGEMPGSISLIITGDEEGPAVNGTVKVLEWAHDQGHRFDGCIVGEPTSQQAVGDMVKIGRRGSLTVTVTALGRQGHVAYPHRAENAAHAVVRLLERLTREPLDQGNAHFDPSTLQVTTIDIGNPASNVVPGEAKAVFNIRYNDMHSRDSLETWVRNSASAAGGRFDIDFSESARPFVTTPGAFVDTVVASIGAVTGLTPELSTSGGTSDARFICHYSPVVELGIVGSTMHQSDERVALADIEKLTLVYADLIPRFFATDDRSA
ncbi:MAG: succinyl-diaminopimelate desuccinylase [Geminicoccaceae bacterium]|nr:succinyl-diaminopimelate desuccinylase [Geminicoccaceae bacterium]